MAAGSIAAVGCGATAPGDITATGTTVAGAASSGVAGARGAGSAAADVAVAGGAGSAGGGAPERQDAPEQREREEHARQEDVREQDVSDGEDGVLVLDATGDGSADDALGPGTLDRSLHERFNQAGFAMTVTHLTRLDGVDGKSLVIVTVHAQNTALAPSVVADFRLRTRSGLHLARYQQITAASGDVLVRGRLLFDVPAEDATSEALEAASLVVGPAGSDRAVVPLGDRPVVRSDRHPVAIGFPALVVPFGPGATGAGEVLVSRVEVGASVSNPEPAADGMVWVGLRYEVCADGPPVTVDPVMVLPRGRRLHEQVHLLEALSAWPECPTLDESPARRVGVAYWRVPESIAGTTATFEMRGPDDQVLASFPLALPAVPDPSVENQMPWPRR